MTKGTNLKKKGKKRFQAKADKQKGKLHWTKVAAKMVSNKKTTNWTTKTKPEPEIPIPYEVKKDMKTTVRELTAKRGGVGSSRGKMHGSLDFEEEICLNCRGKGHPVQICPSKCAIKPNNGEEKKKKQKRK